MKTSRLHLLAIALLIGLSMAACKKNDSTSSTLTGTDVAATQDAESQDAQADNVDQSTDNIADALEANDFSAVKSTEIGAPSINVVSNGSMAANDTSLAAFPKTITIDFSTSADSSINGETFKQSGQIIITVERTKPTGPWRNCLRRTIQFRNFTTGNDSASFSVTGQRVMTRQAFDMTKFASLADYVKATALRISVTDSIKSNLKFIVTCGTTFKDSITRVVNRKRVAMAHFEKANGGLVWHHAFLKDTMKIYGSVTGTNLMDSTYSRVISDNDPIVFTRCAYLIPVISSGTLTVTRDTPKGVKEATITYQQSDCHTLVTVTTASGKTKQFERRLNRMYKKWW